jgi:hypothetical protein
MDCKKGKERKGNDVIKAVENQGKTGFWLQ